MGIVAMGWVTISIVLAVVAIILFILAAVVKRRG